MEHYVAEDKTFEPNAPTVLTAAPKSLWREAWSQLYKRPLFLVASVLILAVVAVSLFPQLFTALDTHSPGFCQLSRSLAGPEAGHPFGFDQQGCDVYTKTIYGARSSVLVGFLTTMLVVAVGGTLGALAGYYGGWLDALIARICDIFFALPSVLGALVVFQMPFFREHKGVFSVVTVLVLFGWPNVARVTRGAVISVKNADYMTSAIALGVSRLGALIKHAIPNALASVIVVATVSLGTFIVAEATLSFLGIGLPADLQSWGQAISDARQALRTNPEIMLYPATALSLTVLGFIMLGDAVRDALDPKARKR